MVLGQSPSDMMQCLDRAGIHLEPHVKSGMLHIHDATPDNDCGELHAWKTQELVEKHCPRCLVIDSISGAMNVDGPMQSNWTAERLVTFARSRGITAVYTCLPQQLDITADIAPLPFAALVDTWLHLTNTLEDGERSRRLTVVKSRGTFASTTTHEVLRTADGISLRKVFVRGERVLTGERRVEAEMRQRAQIASLQREIERLTAQLVAEKLPPEAFQEEHGAGLTGETLPHSGTRPSRKARPKGNTVNGPARSGKKGGTS
ncbi:MAG: hypothetical protein EOP84_29170 [Verrucomicrobiaceae bacterium]|nr:MAG: hypothetical protein EOP84_29170 [Verrucomicrobiaceae bacterium]